MATAEDGEPKAKLRRMEMKLPELETALADAQQRWQQLAVCSGAEDSGAFGGIGIGIDAALLARILAQLLPEQRLSVRSVARGWSRACDRGDGAWLLRASDTLGAWALDAAKSLGVSPASTYARLRFLDLGAAAVFRRELGTQVLPVDGIRLATPEPVLALPHCLGATVVNRAKSYGMPSIFLEVLDMGSLQSLGSISMATIKHGQSVQRPLSVWSLKAAVTLSADTVACVLAIENLVVVFSWRLGNVGAGATQLCDSHVSEVAWIEGNRRLLRAAAFVGPGVGAPVAVLLEGGQKGPIVEIYAQEHDESNVLTTGATYVLQQSALISLLPNPFGKIQGTFLGAFAVWAATGCSSIDTAGSFALQGQRAEQSSGTDASSGAFQAVITRTSRSGSSAALFARGIQALKRGRLRVSSAPNGPGAGIDMEATKWGYLVGEVEKDPGQDAVACGDLIVEIAGQPLHGLPDEDAVAWRFGRSFKDGVEVGVLPAEKASAVLAAQAAEKGAGRVAEVPNTAAAAAKPGPRQLPPSDAQRCMLPSKLEAWTLTPRPAPARLLAIADNCLYLSDLEPHPSAPRQVLSGVAKGNFKRPTLAVAVAEAGSDLVAAGLAKAVLLWRVPALRLGADVDKPDKPELLATVPLPARCSLRCLVLGLGLGASPAGWLSVDISCPGAAAVDGLDVWRFSLDGRVSPAGAGLAVTSSGLAAPGGLEARLGAAGAAVDSVVLAATRAQAAHREDVPLSVWATALPDTDADGLYEAAKRAEGALQELVRDARQWMRRADASEPGHMERVRSVARWSDECRRHLLWPLLQAFTSVDEEAEADAIDYIAADARTGS